MKDTMAGWLAESDGEDSWEGKKDDTPLPPTDSFF